MGQALIMKKNSKVKFEVKEEYFIRNGGILLEKQIALSQGQDIGSGQLTIFSIKDMERATNCFDPNLIVGQARATIYKGTLENRTVAVRTHLMPMPDLINLCLTDASIGLVMNHKNLVKLYGCCLETCIPILVYEFVQNGSLFHCLHGDIAPRKPLKWGDRLRIATNVSYALSYMHNALPKPVVHRDVQSLNVLLDQSFHAKLSNCGLSLPITPDEEPKKWPIEGMIGCIDPEYIETNEVTDKCDVYSFGVLMLELLTGRQPMLMAMEGINLVDVFESSVRNNSIMEMIDEEVLKHGRRDEIQSVVQLVLRCVEKRGMERPSMIEVVRELWLIQGCETK